MCHKTATSRTPDLLWMSWMAGHAKYTDKPAKPKLQSIDEAVDQQLQFNN